MFTMRVLLACGLTILVAASTTHGGDAKSELAKLQGSWIVELDGKKAELKLAKNDFTLTFDDMAKFKGTFKIDPAKKPKHMDLTITEGEKFKGDTAQAIYEVDGDKLKWCAHHPGKDGRATEFPEKQGPTGEYMYLIFKRVK
jgi:uncharacterized protein (TIGR03067 family)